MSLLNQVITGKLKQPILTLLYGPDGVGKSSFGAEAPGAIFVGPENGTANLDVARMPTPENFAAVRASFKALIEDKHDYKTVVVDSADWIEPLVWKAVCALDGSDTIDTAQGGYGKGRIKAIQLWEELMGDMRALRTKRGLHVIILAHSHVKTFNDPSQATPYDRYQLKLDDRAAAKLREFVDSVLFANWEVFVNKDSKGDKKGKATGDDTRYIYTRRRPSFDAKNRYGLPFEIEMKDPVLQPGATWNAFFTAAMSGQPDSLEQIVTDLGELVPMIKDENVRVLVIKTVSEAGEDLSKLTAIRNRVRVLAGEAA